MHLRYVSPHLRQLDTVAGEVLACCLFEDERPMRGVVSLVDWRMTSRVSRYVQRGHITGRFGETTLLPPQPRVPFEKLFLFGLGPIAKFDERVFVETVDRMLHTLTKMRVRMAVVERPGRHTFLIEAPRAVDLIMEASGAAHHQDVWTLVEDPADQKRMAQHLAALRRQKSS